MSKPGDAIRDLISGDYLEDYEICERLGISLGALRGRISTGTGHPPYIKPGRKRLYPVNAVQSWLRSQPLQWSVKDAKRR